MRILGLPLQLSDFHIASGLAEHCVRYLPKLLHVFFKSILSHIPTDIAHEKCLIVGGVCRLLDFFNFLLIRHCRDDLNDFLLFFLGLFLLLNFY